MEGLLAEGALVGPWKILAGFILRGLSILEEGSHEAHRGSRHGGRGGDGRIGGWGLRGRGLLELLIALVVVENAVEVSKTCCGC